MKTRPLKPVFLVAILLVTIFTLSGITNGSYSELSKDNSYFHYTVDGGVDRNEQLETSLRLKRGAPAKPAAGGVFGRTTKTTSQPQPTTSDKPTDGEDVESTATKTQTNSQPSVGETTPLPLPGDSRGWSVSSQLEEQLLNKVDIPERDINETIDTNAKKDGDNITFGTHKYYSSSFVPYEHTWVDLDVLNSSGKANVQEHKMLSKSYRRAATIKLNFKFPFYGHPVDNITIATGGFLYTGDYVHSWLAATQYIAPLMANFDTSQDEEAKIRYADNGTALIVEWKNVYLQTRDPSQKTILEGPFTFQAVLHSNGDIVFAYKEVPIKISNIAHEEHPVKVGLSDAYIIDRTIFFVRRKTIYEYHRVNMKDEEITNSTAIYLKALPTCNLLDTCEKCLGSVDEDSKDLGCQWCGKISICSDGMDRNRQHWLMNSCDNKQNHISATDISRCGEMKIRQNIENRNNDHRDITFPHADRNGDDPEVDETSVTDEEDDDVTQKKLTSGKKGQYHSIGIATISIILCLVLSICGWFIYAYIFPHTWSGQLLIKYRPSRWHWRRGEPRYTAASIHM